MRKDERTGNVGEHNRNSSGAGAGRVHGPLVQGEREKAVKTPLASPGSLWAPSRFETYAKSPRAVPSPAGGNLRPDNQRWLCRDRSRRWSASSTGTARLQTTPGTAPPVAAAEETRALPVSGASASEGASAIPAEGRMLQHFPAAVLARTSSPRRAARNEEPACRAGVRCSKTLGSRFGNTYQEIRGPQASAAAERRQPEKPIGTGYRWVFLLYTK